MKLFKLFFLVLLLISFSGSICARPNGRSSDEKYISALIDVKPYILYSEDGAADSTVMNIGGNAAGMVTHPIPAVGAIVRLGPRAIPLLISHLSDTRLTAIRTGPRVMRVPIGYICLDILTHLTTSRYVLEKNCADDGLGACIRPAFYFRPDAYTRLNGVITARGEIALVKSRWQQSYRIGRVKYAYPGWWARSAVRPSNWVRRQR